MGRRWAESKQNPRALQAAQSVRTHAEWERHVRQAPVERHHGRKRAVEGKPQLKRQRRPFAKTGDVDAPRVNVEAAADVVESAEDVVLNGGDAPAIAPPAETRPAVLSS